VYLCRAQVHFLQGRKDQCLAELTTFLNLGRPAGLEPKGIEVFEQRARLLRRLATAGGLPRKECWAMLELAGDQLKGAVARGGRSAALFDEKGLVLELLARLKKIDPDEAIEVYARALQEPGDDKVKVKVLLKRGWIYAQSLRIPQFDRAQADFAEVLRREPTNAEAHTGLGYLHACRKVPEAAWEEAAQALVHGAGDYRVINNVACIYAVLSQIEPARQAEYENLALVLLRQAVQLAERDGAGPHEKEAIKHEPAFPPSLRARSEFQELLH